MTNNKLTDKRTRLRKAAQDYQSSLSWYQENLDSPNAKQDSDESTAAFKREIGHRETDIIAELLEEIAQLKEELEERTATAKLYRTALENAEVEFQEYRKASREPVMYTVTFEGQVEEIGGDCQSFKREDCQQYIEWLCDENNQDGYAVTPLYAAPPLQAVPTKEHELRELVNELRDIAVKYRDTQQLREHIAKALRAAAPQQ